MLQSTRDEVMKWRSSNQVNLEEKITPTEFHVLQSLNLRPKTGTDVDLRKRCLIYIKLNKKNKKKKRMIICWSSELTLKQ